MILEPGMFNISKYNRNVPIVVKMRSQLSADDLIVDAIWNFPQYMIILVNFYLK